MSMTPSLTPATSPATQSLKDAKQRLARLREDRIRAETELRAVEEELAALEKDALATFGTSDPDILQQKLAEMQSENEALAKDFVDQVARIDAAFAATAKQN